MNDRKAFLADYPGGGALGVSRPLPSCCTSTSRSSGAGTVRTSGSAWSGLRGQTQICPSEVVVPPQTQLQKSRAVFFFLFSQRKNSAGIHLKPNLLTGDKSVQDSESVSRRPSHMHDQDLQTRREPHTGILIPRKRCRRRWPLAPCVCWWRSDTGAPVILPQSQRSSSLKEPCGSVQSLQA